MDQKIELFILFLFVLSSFRRMAFERGKYNHIQYLNCVVHAEGIMFSKDIGQEGNETSETSQKDITKPRPFHLNFVCSIALSGSSYDAGCLPLCLVWMIILFASDVSRLRGPMQEGTEIP
jgi:hypothetical protein